MRVTAGVPAPGREWREQRNRGEKHSVLLGSELGSWCGARGAREVLEPALKAGPSHCAVTWGLVKVRVLRGGLTHA